MYHPSNHLPNHKLSHLVVYASLAGLGLLSLALFFPICMASSQALVLDHQDPKPATISLALDSANEIDITPSSGGQFGAISTKLQIESSSNSGYQVYVSTMDQTNAMVGTKGEIKALVSPSSSTSFPTNTWGYALGTMQAGPETEYQGLPLTPTVVHNTDQATAGTVDTYYLSFGTNIDTSLPAGQYTNNVAVSVIVNPQRITNLSELTYMQDMTSSICANTKGANNSTAQDANGSYIITPGNEVEKRLIDSRDGKEYWVAKLADGNCWMTQNLALDLNEKTLPLKPETSDVKQAWSPRYATRSNAGKLVLNLTTEERAEYDNSWNLGSVVLATPSLGPLCNSAPTTDSTNNDGYNSVRPGFTIAQSCKNFQDVSSGWQPTYTAKIGLWEGKNAGYDNTDGFVTVDTANKTYDAHYLVGNYYQWGSATAGTGTADVVSTGAEQNPSKLVDATGSICPKGWRLPQGGQNTVTAQPFDLDDSAYRLLVAYGYPKTGSYQSNGGTYNIHGIAGTSGTETAYKDMTFSPLRYLSAGYVATWSNSLRDAGANGILWLSTAYVSSDSAYVLHPSRTYIYPSRGLNRHEGGNIRCLAR